jgi:hypothetical protein
MLLTVIAVRPRWTSVVVGLVLAVLGVTERQAVFLIIPGLLFLWHALLTPGGGDLL